jgi:hypothetical protein
MLSCPKKQLYGRIKDLFVFMLSALRNQHVPLSSTCTSIGRVPKGSREISRAEKHVLLFTKLLKFCGFKTFQDYMITCLMLVNAIHKNYFSEKMQYRNGYTIFIPFDY